jgi:hypothetical protein
MFLPSHASDILKHIRLLNNLGKGRLGICDAFPYSEDERSVTQICHVSTMDREHPSQL